MKGEATETTVDAFNFYNCEKDDGVRFANFMMGSEYE